MAFAVYYPLPPASLDPSSPYFAFPLLSPAFMQPNPFTNPQPQPPLDQPLPFDFSFIPTAAGAAFYPPTHLPHHSSPYSALPTSPYPSDYTPSPPHSASVAECKDWLKGRCQRGSTCRFHHSSHLSGASAAASPLPTFLPSSATFVPSPQPHAHHLLTSFSFPSPLSSFPHHSSSQSQPSSPYHPSAAGYAAYPTSPVGFSPYMPGVTFPSGPFPPHHPPTPTYSSTSNNPPFPTHPSYHSPTSSSSTISSPSPIPPSYSSSTSFSPLHRTPAPSDLCRDFQHSVCFRGAACRFLHERQICGDWIHGKCARGEGCKFSHDKKAGPVCRDYVQGRCTRGEECRYWHGDQSHAGGLGGECRDWQKGRCARGSSCKFSHHAQTFHPLQAGAGGGGEEVGKKRGRELPPSSTSAPPPQTVDVTVEPGVSDSLTFKVEAEPDTHNVHITFTNGPAQPHTAQQQPHAEDNAEDGQEQQQQQQNGQKEKAKGEEQEQSSSESDASPAGGAGKAGGSAAVKRGEDSVEEERQINHHGEHLQSHEAAPQKEERERKVRSADNDRIDQTDGAADGDEYLEDHRPTKKRRSNGGR